MSGKSDALEQEINDFLSQSEIVVHGDNMLARMEDLMRVLKNPEKSLRVIHIAGTSGKTSTSYFIAALLESAGLSTVLSVSPHIESVRERAMMNLKPMPEEKWINYVSEFLQIVQASAVRPSYFEFFMGFAYWVARKEKIDFVVVETGLGGRWDGSNVARRSDKICAICDIAKDHVEILGDDIRKIADEKAGIIHPGNWVFMHRQSQEIEDAIQKRVDTVAAQIKFLNSKSENFFERNFTLAKHIVDKALQLVGHEELSEEQIGSARKIQIPARAEKHNYKGKTTILDGSHNPQKLSAFVDYVSKEYPESSRTLLVSVGANKILALDEDMQILRGLSDKIILTSFENKDLETRKRKSIELEKMKLAAKKAGFSHIECVKDANRALERAAQTNADQIIITGSLYLVSALRPLVIKR